MRFDIVLRIFPERDTERERKRVDERIARVHDRVPEAVRTVPSMGIGFLGDPAGDSSSCERLLGFCSSTHTATTMMAASLVTLRTKLFTSHTAGSGVLGDSPIPLLPTSANSPLGTPRVLREDLRSANSRLPEPEPTPAHRHIMHSHHYAIIPAVEVA